MLIAPGLVKLGMWWWFWMQDGDSKDSTWLLLRWSCTACLDAQLTCMMRVAEVESELLH
jgi:hypothetical protein